MKIAIKKQTPVFYLTIVGMVLAVLGLVFTFITSTDAYPLFSFGKIITLHVITIVMLAVSDVLCVILKLDWLKDILRLVSIITIGAAFGYLLTDRLGLLGFTYLSTVAAGDSLAMGAMNSAITAWIFDILCMLIVMISGFFKSSPAEK